MIHLQNFVILETFESAITLHIMTPHQLIGIKKIQKKSVIS